MFTYINNQTKLRHGCAEMTCKFEVGNNTSCLSTFCMSGEEKTSAYWYCHTKHSLDLWKS